MFFFNVKYFLDREEHGIQEIFQEEEQVEPQPARQAQGEVQKSPDKKEGSSETGGDRSDKISGREIWHQE